MAKPIDGERPRHKQWLGAYGSQPTTTMKYRIPEKLVKYLIENAGVKKLQNSWIDPSSQANTPMVSVVTRHGTTTQHGDADSDSQVPDPLPPPLHPPRSTLGKRRWAQKQLHSSVKVEIGSESGDEEGFFTPPESPRVPSEIVPPPPEMSASLENPEILSPSQVEDSEEALPSHERVVDNPPPSHPTPLVFKFKAQRDLEA